MSSVRLFQGQASGSSTGKLTSVEYGIYMQGKNETAVCSQWLIDEAPARTKQEQGLRHHDQNSKAGIVISGSVRPRGSGKAAPKRASAKSIAPTGIAIRPSQYLSVTRDIIAAAERSNQRLQVPEKILHSFREAIRIREIVCSIFASEQIDEHVMESNRRHARFVQILKHTLRLLVPFEQLEPPIQANSINGGTSPAKSHTNRVLETAESLTNASQPLEDMLDISEEEIEVAGTEADQLKDPFAAACTEKSRTNSRDRYIKMCQVQCLLQDVDDLVKLIHHKWKLVAQGDCDGATATIITHLAIDSVAALERGFKLKGCGDIDIDTESAFSEHLSTKQDGSGSSEKHFNFRAAFGLAKSLVNIKRFHIANHYLGGHHAIVPTRQGNSPAAVPKHEEQSRRSGRKPQKHHLAETHEPISWSTSEQHALSKYGGSCAHPFSPGIIPLEQCKLDPVAWGYNVQDLSLLEEIFSDNLGPCADSMSCHGFLEDLVLTQLRLAVGSNEVSMATAFSVQVFLDIRSILGTWIDVLVRLDRTAISMLQERISGYEHLDEIAGKVKAPVESKYCISSKNMLDGQIRPGSPAEQKNLRFCLSHSPLASSFRCLGIRRYANWIHLKALDTSTTVKICLHFYNAMQQLHLIKTPWADMEALIELHGSHHIFKGRRPKKLEDCLSVLRLVMDLPFDLGMIYSGRGVVSSKDNEESQGHFAYNLTVLMDLIYSSQLQKTSYVTLEQMVNTVLVLEHEPDFDIKLRDERAGLAFPDELARRAKRYGTPGRIESLHLIADRMNKELKKYEAFEWAALDKICWDMLIRLHSTFVATGIWRKMPWPTYTEELLLESAIGRKETAVLIFPLLAFARHNEGLREEEMARLRSSSEPRQIVQLDEYEKQAEDTREVLIVAVDEMTRTINTYGSQVVDALEAKKAGIPAQDADEENVGRDETLAEGAPNLSVSNNCDMSEEVSMTNIARIE